MEKESTRVQRKREPNFTAEEKALLMRLIKSRPVIDNKLTDGETVEKKRTAWEEITREFNHRSKVYHRDTITLKRGWDNLKSMFRKARKKAAAKSHQISTESMLAYSSDGFENQSYNNDSTFEDSSQHIYAVDVKMEYSPSPKSDRSGFSVASGMAEQNSFGQNSFEQNSYEQNNFEQNTTNEKFNVPTEVPVVPRSNPVIPDPFIPKTILRTPVDFVKREAVLRLKHFKTKRSMEMKILETQLEAEEIKKRSAILEEERAMILLEKAQLELSQLKSNLNK